MRFHPLMVWGLLTSVSTVLAFIGFSNNLAFSLVFTAYILLLLVFLNRKLIEAYGNHRAIKIGIYGLVLVVILLNILELMF